LYDAIKDADGLADRLLMSRDGQVASANTFDPSKANIEIGTHANSGGNTSRRGIARRGNGERGGGPGGSGNGGSAAAKTDNRTGMITPPEATNTGPSGSGARGCGFEERVGAYARTEGGHFL